jgi:outer membrane protein assembly factor BamA
MRLILFTCILFFVSFFEAQNFTLDIKGLKTKIKYKNTHNTEENAITEINKVIKYLQTKGYLLASYDSIKSLNKVLSVKINEGEIYKWANLKIGNLNSGVANLIGYNEKQFNSVNFNPQQTVKLINKIITYYENHGHPFVTVKLDSVEIDSNTINATLNVNKNKLYIIDSVVIIGNLRLNKKFLQNYISIKEKDFYNETLLKDISKKIKQLPFINEKQPQMVRLTDKQNKLLLFLDKKNASQFDGIIGFLPDANTKKTIVTGDVKLKLINGILKNGETIDVQWRRIQNQTSDFKGRFIYPYLFGFPFGIDYNIRLFKKDTTFLEVQNNFGLQYYFSGLNYIKAFYKIKSTNLLSTTGYSLITTLPDYADVQTFSYGLATGMEFLDYKFNPRKGISINASTQAGTKKIIKNNKVNEIAYNGLKLNSTQYQLELDFASYLPIYKNNILKFGLQAASVFGNTSLFKNELFRFGGFRTLRGFNEESIYASSYVIPTIEYRYLFAKNSNLFIFSEGAWYENNAGLTYIKDIPYSFGAGISIETKAGILTLSYSQGQQFNNGFDGRNGKIHIGLVALL